MTILVTCTSCGTDNRVEAVDMIVRFSEYWDERAAELLFACTACGGAPVQRVPKELAAVVVLRGAASLTVEDRLPTVSTAPPTARRAAPLSPDDLLQLHLQLQDRDSLRRFLDEPGPQDD